MGKKPLIPFALLPLAGSKPSVIDKITEGKQVDAAFKTRLRATRLAASLSKPFRLIETFKYQDKITQTALPKNPLFIIGHWRSGTTFLHNLISKDPQFGYVTTYQSVFPHVTLSGKWLFRNFMQLAMPDKRPADNVKLSASFPQEEEFALSNMHGLSFYNFWYFPQQTKDFFHQYLTFDQLTPQELNIWKKNYEQLIKTALINCRTQNIILKNPPSTGRIKTILEVFPQAKFIHIYRNPIVVFLSTLRFFENTMPALQLHHIDRSAFLENIFWVYTELMQRYETEKKLIPEGNLIELKFESFEENPLEKVNQIYSTLQIPGFDKALPEFTAYLETQKKFKMNKNKISRELLDQILDRWGYFMEYYQYKIPENISIFDEKSINL